MGIDIAANRSRDEKMRQDEARRKAAAEKRAALASRTRAAVDGFKEGYRGSGYVCTQCGMPGRPKRIVKGNILVEIFLWLLFLLPGLIYTIWRSASSFKGCPDCRTQTMVRADSPAGKRLLGAG